MKQPALPAIAAVSLLAVLPLTGCKPQPTTQQQEQEIDRRVAQKLADKLAEERVRWQQAALDQKSRDLAARERRLRQREQQATVPGAASADSRALLADYQLGNDQVGGGPCGSYNAFYKYLAPYGNWFDLPYYGLVWQPAAATGDPRWRPYTVGQWAYSSDAGWTWITAEPFGWAAYHYGRWVCLAGIGWLWSPGTQWASAWVAWRTSNDYVGWAPLPPEIRIDAGVSIGPGVDAQGAIASSWYSFVPFISFGEQNLSRELVAPDDSGAIMDQTANVTHLAVNNALVVNEGPPLDELQRRSRTPLNILKLVRRNDLPPQQMRLAGNGVLEIPGAFIGNSLDPVQLPSPVRALSQQAALRPQRSPTASWITPAPWPERHAPALSAAEPQPSAPAIPQWPRVQPETVRPLAPAASPLSPARRIQASAPAPSRAPEPPHAPEPPRQHEAAPARPPEPSRTLEPLHPPELPRQHEAAPARTPEPSRASEPAHEESPERSKPKENASASPR